MRQLLLSAVLVSAMAMAPGGSRIAQGQTAETYPYDHIHLNVPDPAEAARWYEAHFGGTRIEEAPDRLMYGSTRLLFSRRANAQWTADQLCVRGPNQTRIEIVERSGLPPGK